MFKIFTYTCKYIFQVNFRWLDATIITISILCPVILHLKFLILNGDSYSSPFSWRFLLAVATEAVSFPAAFTNTASLLFQYEYYI